MKENESTTDRIVRIILGLILVGIGWFYLKNNITGIIFDIIGVVAIFTGIAGVCLIYKIFGFSTKK